MKAPTSTRAEEYSYNNDSCGKGQEGSQGNQGKKTRSCNKPVSRDIDYSLSNIGSNAYIPGSGKPEGYKM
ncbi:MAG: hypothetical protein U5L72_14215 [Bacteroidales bacterium]|nr:hypothetical protein [Bacteroidales bacterium]